MLTIGRVVPDCARGVEPERCTPKFDSERFGVAGREFQFCRIERRLSKTLLRSPVDRRSIEGALRGAMLGLTRVPPLDPLLGETPEFVRGLAHGLRIVVRRCGVTSRPAPPFVGGTASPFERPERPEGEFTPPSRVPPSER